jgi:hypothetical protein
VDLAVVLGIMIVSVHEGRLPGSRQRHMTYINNLIYRKIIILAMFILAGSRVTWDLSSSKKILAHSTSRTPK